MSTKGIADVVFCIDASASMQPCVDSVKSHIEDFIDGLSSGNYASWDLHFDFLAHSVVGETAGNFVYRHMSINHEDCQAALYNVAKPSGFFTSDISVFKKALDNISVSGDEASLIGLDFALDYPWRQSAECHRVVIMLTDEPLEGGVRVNQQMEAMTSIIEKIHQLKVMLFLVAPESPGFDQLSAADRSEWEVIDDTDNGLCNTDFHKVLGCIGKSISKSTVQTSKQNEVQRSLFGQSAWGESSSFNLLGE